MQAPEIGRLVAEQITTGAITSVDASAAAPRTLRRRDTRPAGSSWCSDVPRRRSPDVPDAAGRPGQAAWIEATATELAAFGEQHRAELDTANRANKFPRELYRELGRLGYLGPLVPAE